MALPIPKQIDFMVDAERDAWVTDHGDSAEVMRAELAILNQIKKTCETKIEALRLEAIEVNFAYNKQVWTEEHTVRGHFKKRFTWIK